MYHSLETDEMFAHYDDVKRILFIQYYRAASAEVTRQAYQWLREISTQITDIRGCVYDFRKVRHFRPDNQSAVTEESTALNQDFDFSSVPVAIVVDNMYQEQMVKKTLSSTPQVERKTIVYTFPEAFQFFRDFHENINTPPLEYGQFEFDSDGATVNYDPHTGITRIMYYGFVTPQTTSDVYSKMIENVGIAGLESVRAGFFDFRHVSQFDNSNMRVVQRNSSNMNVSYDMSHIAVALIVEGLFQDRMVRTAMKVTPQEERKRVVQSYKEAQEFTNEFHAKLEEKR